MLWQGYACSTGFLSFEFLSCVKRGGSATNSCPFVPPRYRPRMLRQGLQGTTPAYWQNRGDEVYFQARQSREGPRELAARDSDPAKVPRYQCLALVERCFLCLLAVLVLLLALYSVAGIKVRAQWITALEAIDRLDHENIIRLLDWFETESDFVVVTQFASGGDWQAIFMWPFDVEELHEFTPGSLPETHLVVHPNKATTTLGKM